MDWWAWLVEKARENSRKSCTFESDLTKAEILAAMRKSTTPDSSNFLRQLRFTYSGEVREDGFVVFPAASTGALAARPKAECHLEELGTGRTRIRMTVSWLGSTVLELVVNTFGIIVVFTAFGPRIGLFAGVAILALTVFGLRMVPGSAKRLERKLQRSLVK